MSYHSVRVSWSYERRSDIVMDTVYMMRTVDATQTGEVIVPASVFTRPDRDDTKVYVWQRTPIVRHQVASVHCNFAHNPVSDCSSIGEQFMRPSNASHLSPLR